MKVKVYLDTSVISALFDGRTPERMRMTESAWAKLSDYEVYLSDVVMEELKRVSKPLQEIFFYIGTSHIWLNSKPGGWLHL